MIKRHLDNEYVKNVAKIKILLKYGILVILGLPQLII